MFSPALRTEAQRGSAAAEREAAEARLKEEEERLAAMSMDEEEGEDLDEFNPYFFIAHLPQYESVCEKGKICLPTQKGAFRPTLALDLDETLVHCTVEPIANPDVIFPVM
jgi:CTD small phosphatase-like protein 2